MSDSGKEGKSWDKVMQRKGQLQQFILKRTIMCPFSHVLFTILYANNRN